MLFLVDKAAGNQQRKRHVLVPGGFEAPIQPLLNVFPQRPAVRPHDHAAAHRRVVRQLRLQHQLVVPLRKILCACRKLFFGHACVVHSLSSEKSWRVNSKAYRTVHSVSMKGAIVGDQFGRPVRLARDLSNCRTGSLIGSRHFALRGKPGCSDGRGCPNLDKISQDRAMSGARRGLRVGANTITGKSLDWSCRWIVGCIPTFNFGFLDE